MLVAIIQDGPEYFDLTRTMDKTISLIGDASNRGARLIVFGECWLSGYPVWLDICRDVNIWESDKIKKVWEKMFRSAPSVDGPEIEKICSMANDLDVHIVMGLNETVRSGPGQGTIYNSVVTIVPGKGVSNHHRKLMPTYTERLVHGLGDANGLRTVDTSLGRLGSLICWEHWMPLARQAMHDQGEDIHIALWPMVKEMNHVACRSYSFEGRCVVVAVGQIMHRDELPDDLTLSDEVQVPDNQLIMRGGSAVYDSRGNFILPQVYDRRDILLVDIEPDTQLGDRMNLDVSGHYQRPDVFTFEVDRSDRRH